MARSLHEEGLAIRRQLGDKQGVASSLAQLANLAASRADYASARSLYSESLVIRRELQDKRGIAECVERLAGLASTQGVPERETRLFGAAENLRETIQMPLPPIDLAAHDSEVTALRSRLQEEVFTVAWRDGRAMTWEQAIAYALVEEDAEETNLPKNR